MGTASAALTVDQAATELRVHRKTVLRYIREGRLPATRIGKSYRVARARLNAFAGLADEPTAAAPPAPRATCVVELPVGSAAVAERIATLLQSAALARPGGAAVHLQTAFDPLAASLKLVIIASPSVVAGMLEMVQLRTDEGF